MAESFVLFAAIYTIWYGAAFLLDRFAAPGRILDRLGDWIMK